eukprot:5466684-Amphidinium_carterae.1
MQAKRSTASTRQKTGDKLANYTPKGARGVSKQSGKGPRLLWLHVQTDNCPATRLKSHCTKHTVGDASQGVSREHKEPSRTKQERGGVEW